MQIKDLDLNLLVVFEAIYEARNISRAADLLDLSQPAISNALKRLRAQTGDQLFSRNAKGVEPTVHAEEMIIPIRSALALIRQSSVKTKFDPLTHVRRFQLMVGDPLEPIFLPHLMNAMSGTRLSVELTSIHACNIEDALVGGKIDMAAFFQPPEVPGLRVQELFPIDIVVIARTGHPRIQGEVLPQHIQSEEHIAMNLAHGKLPNSEKVSVNRRSEHAKICLAHTSATLVRTVAETDCIAFLPRAYAQYAAPIFNLQVLKAPRRINDQSFYLVWHERSDDDPSHKWLRDLFLERADLIRAEMAAQI